MTKFPYNLQPTHKLKAKSYKLNEGMTYVELIVVLGIFSLMVSVVLFNYGVFQAKVEIKNLAGDIALKIVEAQKSSLSGKLPPPGHPITASWKPSYGVYFNLANDSLPNKDNKSFIYFADLDASSAQNNLFDGADCTPECLEKITITKGNYISSLNVFYRGDSNPHGLNDFTVTFRRPDSGAVLVSGGDRLLDVSYVQIAIVSPREPSAIIKVYPSGRIQVD